MANTELPASGWMAEQFCEAVSVKWFAEDIYAYDSKTGLYRQKAREWLNWAVHHFLAECLGSERVDAAYVSRVCRSIKHVSYIDESQQPPFWIDRNDVADVFVTANKVLRLDTLSGEGRVTSDDHTSTLFAVSGVPYEFAVKAECPKWLDFLSWMVGGNRQEVKLIQQFCAWVFVAKQLKLEKILWLCGRGRNGKSTALRVIRYVIGEASTSAVGLEAFSGGQNFRLWPTLHKLANFSNDSLVRRNSNVASLNAYISGDPFTINRKFREQLTVEPTTVCFFASNPMPLLNDPSDAFWRRLLLIWCNQKLDENEVNPHLISELKAEAPGILNWMLAAIPELLTNCRFDVPASVRGNVENLKAEVNSVRQFIGEKLEVGKDSNDFITRDQFMGVYESWCVKNLVKKEDLKVVKDEMQRAFDSDLRRRRKGPQRERVPCWSGVRWKPEEKPQETSLVAHLTRDQVARIEEQKQEIDRLRKQLANYEPFNKPQTSAVKKDSVEVAESFDAVPLNQEEDFEAISQLINELPAEGEPDVSVVKHPGGAK